jgi:hypothetical protein
MGDLIEQCNMPASPSLQPETPAHFMLERPACAALRSHRFAAAVANAEQDTETATWRMLMKLTYDVVPNLILSAWMLRRAALTGREANGGNPMALPSVPATDIT